MGSEGVEASRVSNLQKGCGEVEDDTVCLYTDRTEDATRINNLTARENMLDQEAQVDKSET